MRRAAEEWERGEQRGGNEGEGSVEKEAKGGADDERKSDEDLREEERRQMGRVAWPRLSNEKCWNSCPRKCAMPYQLEPSL